MQRLSTEDIPIERGYKEKEVMAAISENGRYLVIAGQRIQTCEISQENQGSATVYVDKYIWVSQKFLVQCFTFIPYRQQIRALWDQMTRPSQHSTVDARKQLEDLETQFPRFYTAVVTQYIKEFIINYAMRKCPRFHVSKDVLGLLSRRYRALIHPTE